VSVAALDAREGASPQSSPTATKSIAALFLLVLMWVGLVVWASPVFRGSDQTWYVEDVHTIVAGAPAQTHEVYPFSLIGPDRRFDTARPFVHNVPVLWVWAGAAKAAGGDPHTGILLVNMLSCLGAAVFVYLASRRFVPRHVALAAVVAMLYMPVFFWIAGQDLAEPLSALLVAAAAYLVIRWPRKLAAWLGAETLAALAAVGRIWTLPFLLALPAGLLFLDQGRPWPRRLGRAAIALVAGAVVYLPLSWFFQSYVPAPTVLALLDVSLASNNMILYFTTTPARGVNAAALVAALVRNTVAALRTQLSIGRRLFMVTRWLPVADLWPVNLAIVLAASGLFARGTDRLRRFVMALAVVAFGMHLATAVLLQTQPRYLVPLLPPIALGATVAAGLWLERGRGRPWVARVATALLCVTLATFVSVDVISAGNSRAGAFWAAHRRVMVSTLIETSVPASARVVLDTSYGARWTPDWGIFPRQELALGTDFRIPLPDYEKMLRLFKPDYLVTDSTSGLPEALRRLGLYSPEYLGESTGYTLWRLSPPVPAGP
jgi:4-amino-4-deoxy-L-arabinose transferase-like glycosyltransferase